MRLKWGRLPKYPLLTEFMFFPRPDFSRARKLRTYFDRALKTPLPYSRTLSNFKYPPTGHRRGAHRLSFDCHPYAIVTIHSPQRAAQSAPDRLSYIHLDSSSYDQLRTWSSPRIIVVAFYAIWPHMPPHRRNRPGTTVLWCHSAYSNGHASVDVISIDYILQPG